MPHDKNVKTHVFTATTGRVGRTNLDPILLLVYQTVKHYNSPLVQRMKTETFGKGIDLRKATPQDLEQIGMVPDGCHGFPLTDGRQVHMWIDITTLLRRHSLYLRGTSFRVGYLDMSNDAYTNLCTKMDSKFKAVKKLTPSHYSSVFR